MEYAVAVAAAAVVLYLRVGFARITVLEYERGLKYRKGKYVGVVGPGRHWVHRASSLLRKVDVRPRFVSIAGQEVLSSDGVTLKVSLAARYEVADPAVAVNNVENFQEALYLTLQLALRRIVGHGSIDEVLSSRDEFSQKLMELSAAPAESLGLRLLDVDVKDIMFPGELKKIFAQVVRAQKEGLAALEKARGETAALRNLANAARMVEGSPALMQLRLLQQVGGSAGNTIVLGFPGSSVPLPLREQGAEQAPGIEAPSLPPEAD